MQSGRVEKRYAIKFCFKLGKNDATETFGMLQTAFGVSCMNRASVFEWHKRFKESAGSLWGMMTGVEGVRKSIHQSWSAKVLWLGLLCWGFKGVQEAIPSKEASSIGSVAFPPGQRGQQQRGQQHRLSGISTRTIHQSTTPSLSQTIWPRWASRQFLSLPKSRPCSLCLFVIPQAHRLSLWNNWGVERGCEEGDWHAHPRGLPWGIPEVVDGTVQQVHWSRGRLLQRGLEIHVCTINKSAHTKKL